MHGHATRVLDRVIEPERQLPVIAEADVIVAGGGPAGLAGAIAAGRCGARTLLVERYGFLGGTATVALMTVWNANLDTTTGFARELIERLARESGAVVGPATAFNPETLKLLALDLIREAGVRLLLHAIAVAPVLEGDTVVGVVTESKSGREAILGRVVVDCSGDADLAAAAGVECVKGREQDGKMRPMSLVFRVGGLEVAELVAFARAHPENFTADPTFHVLEPERGLVRIFGFFREVEDARQQELLDKDCHYLRFESVDIQHGTAFINSTRAYGLDGTNAWDITRGEIELRRQMRQLLEFIRTLPGCRRVFTIDSATSLGVRETRRIRGEALLTEEDIAAGKSYEDTIARLHRRGEIGRETHSPDGGEGAAGDVAWRTLHWPLVAYEVPYGVLVPQRVDGLLVAGRTISQTHGADKYTRSMHCCMVLGQAAGTAAAIAVRQGVHPRNVDRRRVQEALLGQGVDLGEQAARFKKESLSAAVAAPSQEGMGSQKGRGPC